MAQATASGLYIAEKIDLLVSYLIAGPLARLLVKQFPKVPPPPPPLAYVFCSGAERDLRFSLKATTGLFQGEYLIRYGNALRC